MQSDQTEKNNHHGGLTRIGQKPRFEHHTTAEKINGASEKILSREDSVNTVVVQDAVHNFFVILDGVQQFFYRHLGYARRVIMDTYG